MKDYKFSVVIPAHNEEKYIGKCIKSVIEAAGRVSPEEVQIIVSANRCTDKTISIAESMGAQVCINDEKCISSVRNAGVNAAKGRIVVTIDADSVMSADSLEEISEMLYSGKYIGGGTRAKFERMSLGIFMSAAYVALNLAPAMAKSKAFLSGGMFWFYKADFDAIGGFDENLVSLEDLDFAQRLKSLADTQNKKYGTLKKSYIITSSRKFDEFGDWYLIKNKKITKKLFSGRDREAADKFYYDIR